MKYIIKFRKEGKIRFISHLDLQKVFLRLFRIIGIKPKYSNGFNPHPKLSFALPLSLGFGSKAEYLELETEEESSFDFEMVNSKLKSYLPDGLVIEYIRVKPHNINKKLASFIDSAQYKIKCPINFHTYTKQDIEKLIKKYLDQKEIPYEKKSRKSGKTNIIDLKKSIYDMKLLEVDNNYITLSCSLHAGNDSVLNPNVLITNFYEFMDIPLDITDLIVTRTNVFCQVDNSVINVDSIF